MEQELSKMIMEKTSLLNSYFSQCFKQSKKANGRDGISARMLKSTAPSITLSNALQFNKSISTGKIPKGWKVSSVIRIPKGSNPISMSNYVYRLILLLSIISKLLERHKRHLISCLSHPNTLSNCISLVGLPI